MILEIRVDTADIISGDWDTESVTFEDLVTAELKSELKKAVLEEVTKAQKDDLVKELSSQVKELVQGEILSILNEDIAISDRWGTTEFIGSVSDYIKREIDNTYMHPVDSDGSKLSGCTSSSQTWIQWHLKKETTKYVKRMNESAEYNIKKALEKEIKDHIEDFTNKTLKTKVMESLEAVGVK